jgi:hypothetical protein
MNFFESDGCSRSCGHFPNFTAARTFLFHGPASRWTWGCLRRRMPAAASAPVSSAGHGVDRSILSSGGDRCCAPMRNFVFSSALRTLRSVNGKPGASAGCYLPAGHGAKEGRSFSRSHRQFTRCVTLFCGSRGELIGGRIGSRWTSFPAGHGVDRSISTSGDRCGPPMRNFVFSSGPRTLRSINSGPAAAAGRRFLAGHGVHPISVPTFQRTSPVG